MPTLSEIRVFRNNASPRASQADLCEISRLCRRPAALHTSAHTASRLIDVRKGRDVFESQRA